MVSQVVSFRDAFARRGDWSRGDWTRDELAELYRIEHALMQARVAVLVDRGLTDEGDPWFVFCRSDGEVLVHISRFDGEYRLHTSAFSAPLTGRSFVALAKSFVDQIPMQTPLRAANGTSVYVHPSAMLAVIVGTIFYSWDELIARTSHTDDGDGTAGHAAAGDVRKEDKGAPQHTVLSYIESFLARREHGQTNDDSSYINLITAVAAYIVTVGIGVSIDAAPDAALADESAGDDASQSTPELNFAAIRTEESLLAHRIQGGETALAAAMGVDIDQNGVAAPVAPQANIALDTSLHGLVTPTADVAGQIGKLDDLLSQAFAAKKAAPSDADGLFDAFLPAVRTPSASAAAQIAQKDAAVHAGATQGEDAHGTGSGKGGESAGANGDFLDFAALKSISDAISTSANVKTIVPVDNLPAAVTLAVSQGISILDQGDAIDFLHQHQDALGPKMGPATTQTAIDATAATPASAANYSPPIDPSAMLDTSVSVMSTFGQEIQSLSSEAFAQVLGSFLSEVTNVELLVSKDSIVFVNADIIDKMDSGALGISLKFADGSSISVIGQPAALLHIVEMI